MEITLYSCKIISMYNIACINPCKSGSNVPCKHAGMGLYWSDAGSIGPVLARYWPITACSSPRCSLCHVACSCQLGSEETYMQLILNSPCPHPCKHAISCQYRPCTGPMLALSAQYWHITACLWGGHQQFQHLHQSHLLSRYFLIGSFIFISV